MLKPRDCIILVIVKPPFNEWVGKLFEVGDVVGSKEAHDTSEDVVVFVTCTALDLKEIFQFEFERDGDAQI